MKTNLECQIRELCQESLCSNFCVQMTRDGWAEAVVSHWISKVLDKLCSWSEMANMLLYSRRFEEMALSTASSLKFHFLSMKPTQEKISWRCSLSLMVVLMLSAPVTP